MKAVFFWEASNNCQARAIELDGKAIIQRLIKGVGLNLYSGGAWSEPLTCQYNNETKSSELNAILLDVTTLDQILLMMCLIDDKLVTLKSGDDGETWGRTTED